MVIIESNFGYVPILLLFIIFSYFVIRDYFVKNIESNKKVLNKKLSLLMIISGIICILGLFEISYKYNQKSYNLGFIYFLFNFDSVAKYEFRIIGLLLLVIFIGFMIFTYIKNKSALSIFGISIGVLANYAIYIDFYKFNWSKLSYKNYELTAVGAIFLIIYLFIYILLIVRSKRESEV